MKNQNEETNPALDPIELAGFNDSLKLMSSPEGLFTVPASRFKNELYAQGFIRGAREMREGFEAGIRELQSCLQSKGKAFTTGFLKAMETALADANRETKIKA